MFKISRLKINKIASLFYHKITIVILASLFWLISLPASSVQAEGFYTQKDHKVAKTEPYYSTKEHRVKIIETARPYYSTKDRKKVTVIKTRPAIGDNDLQSGTRLEERSSRDWETRNAPRINRD